MGCSNSAPNLLRLTSAAQPQQEEFQVVLIKAAGGPLGFHVEGHDGRAVVASIGDHGPLQDWNEQHPGSRVYPGDVIVAVNGISDSIMEMTAEFRRAGTLKVVMIPGPHVRGPIPLQPAEVTVALAGTGAATTSSEVSQSQSPVQTNLPPATTINPMTVEQGPQDIHVCLTKSEGSMLGFYVCNKGGGSGDMTVQYLQERGIVRDWNAQNPTKEVRPGDKILEVNGVSGDYWEMLTELQKLGPLHLVITRGSGCTSQEPARLGPYARRSGPSWAALRLQFRTLGPDDFEQLLALDEGLPKRDTVPQSFVDGLPRARSSDCGITECRVCFEELEANALVVQLPCGHAFHPECATRWLTQCKRQCPLCAVSVDGEGPDLYPPRASIAQETSEVTMEVVSGAATRQDFPLALCWGSTRKQPAASGWPSMTWCCHC